MSTTSDPTYSLLPSFAGASSTQYLQAWADKDSGGAARVFFEYVGPTDTLQTPRGISRTLAALLSETAPPHRSGSGTTYSLKASFQEAVQGLATADLQTALGAPALAAGWTVSAAPLSRDGGRTWTFQIQSPPQAKEPLTLRLAADAASSTLVNGLASSASNGVQLSPVAGGGDDSGNGGQIGGGFTTVVATGKRDLLTGTDAADTFLFPTFRTGRPGHRLKRLDEIVGYEAEDRIAISKFPDRVVGDTADSRQITSISATASDLSIRAIRSAVKPFLAAREAAVISINGYGGSFLVVNDTHATFNNKDMLVRLVDFVPTADTPLTFI